MANKTYGDLIFGVRDCKVAAFGTTTAYDVYGIQEASLTITQATAELPGDDVILAQISRPTGGTISLTNAAISDEALEIITGQTFTASGSSPTEVNTLVLEAADQFPYILIGVQGYDDSTGDMHIYVWKAKLAESLTLTLSNGNWLTPEMTFNFVQDSTNSRMVSIVQRETAAAIAFS